MCFFIVQLVRLNVVPTLLDGTVYSADHLQKFVEMARKSPVTCDYLLYKEILTAL